VSGTNTAESGADPGPRGSFLSRLWRICRGYYTEPATRTRAIWLTVLVLALTFIQIGIQVLFNLWNRAFFDALEARDRAEFWRQGLLFLGLLAASVAATVAHTWSRQVLALDWRKWLVHRLQSRWLEGGRHYQMNFLPGMADNPDQRISENTRWATTLAVELGVGLLTSFVMLVSFIGILWTLSGPLHVAFGANEFEIPGYMVWGALIYATLGAGFTVLVGAPMVDINIRRNEAEGDHRFALIRMRENSESIALIRGEADEDRGLRASFSRVLRVMGDLYGAERRLLWLTSAYGWRRRLCRSSSPRRATSRGYHARRADADQPSLPRGDALPQLAGGQLPETRGLAQPCGARGGAGG
jgi:putative ATP-binding cassette transporter